MSQSNAMQASTARAREPPSPSSAPAPPKKQRGEMSKGGFNLPTSFVTQLHRRTLGARDDSPSGLTSGAATPRAPSGTATPGATTSGAASHAATPRASAGAPRTTTRQRATTSAGDFSTPVANDELLALADVGGASNRRLVDIVLELRSTIHRLESQVASMDTAMKKIHGGQSQLLNNADKGDLELSEVREDVDGLVGRADKHHQRLKALEQAIENAELQFAEGGAPAANEQTNHSLAMGELEAGANATEAELRSSSFFAVIRAVFIGLMGVTKKAKPPAPLKLGFWTVDDDADPDRLLRPRWEDGWEANREGWSLEAIQKVKQDGQRWSTSLSQQMLDVLPADLVEKGLCTSFNTWAKRYRDQRDKDAETRLKIRIANRRRARKHTKASERLEYRDQVPALMDESYDWVFLWQYQSTDESDAGTVQSVVHQDAGALPVVLKLSGSRAKPWKKRAPAYRKAGITPHLDTIDVLVEAAHIEDEDDNCNGTTHHARIRGEDRSTTDSVLPVVRQRKNQKPGEIPATKIPLEMLDPGWLKSVHGQKFASLKYISGWCAGDGDVDGGTDGDDEDNAEAEGED